jgi:hypothetical protein
MKRSAVGFTLWALALHGSAIAQAGEKFTLKQVSAAGDVASLASDMKLSLKMKVLVNGQEAPSMTTEQSEQKAYTKTVVAVDAKAHPTVLRVHYTKYRSRQTPPGGAPVSSTSPAEGRTVTLKRSGGKTVVTIDKGKLSAKDKKDLADEMKEVEFDPYPGRPMAAGEEWDLDSKALAKAFGVEGNASVHGKIQEKVQRNGRPVALCRLTLEVEGTLPGEPAKLRMKLEGDLYYDLTLNRTLSVALTGPVNLSGEITESDQKINISGDGTATMHMSSKWIKVAGKPIAQ